METETKPTDATRRDQAADARATEEKPSAPQPEAAAAEESAPPRCGPSPLASKFVEDFASFLAGKNGPKAFLVWWGTGEGVATSFVVYAESEREACLSVRRLLIDAGALKDSKRAHIQAAQVPAGHYELLA